MSLPSTTWLGFVIFGILCDHHVFSQVDDSRARSAMQAQPPSASPLDAGEAVEGTHIAAEPKSSRLRNSDSRDPFLDGQTAELHAQYLRRVRHRLDRAMRLRGRRAVRQELHALEKTLDTLDAIEAEEAEADKKLRQATTILREMIQYYPRSTAAETARRMLVQREVEHRN